VMTAPGHTAELRGGDAQVRGWMVSLPSGHRQALGDP